jgi:peptidoglycan/xylan/chitin deacetylase (PgdA/CDA1 family)
VAGSGWIASVPTVIAVTDAGNWARTDVIVLADAGEMTLTWVPRDLWCEALHDRVNGAFARDRAQGLIDALGEHGLAATGVVCVRREATERALAEVSVTVPVAFPMEFWYPRIPGVWVQEASKRVSFSPPREVLSGERIHQWVGARYGIHAYYSDLDRIARQQTFLRSLMQAGFDFASVLSDPDLVSISGADAIEELARVDASWKFETFDDLVPVTIDGQKVLVPGGPAVRPVPVLMYHHVGSPPRDARWPELWVRPEDLAGQLSDLAGRGYTGITLSEMHEAWNGGRALPPRAVVITFDDGDRSVHDAAGPALQAVDWPGVLNLNVGLLRSDEGVTTTMVEALLGAGWELASHSLTHPDLTKLDDPRLKAEVSWSRIALQHWFDVPVDFFCYPAGRFSDRVVHEVREAGYSGATTTLDGLAAPDAPFTLRRVRVSRSDGAQGVGARVDALTRFPRA